MGIDDKAVDLRQASSSDIAPFKVFSGGDSGINGCPARN